MNAQTSDFSAVYGNCPTGICMQPGAAQQPSPLLNSVEGSGVAGTRQNAGSSVLPITDLNQPQPMSAESIQYLNGFLRTQIGNRVKVEFLVGTNTYLEKSGKLLAVGANYIILQEAMSDDLIVCDFFNIKFITIFR